MSGGIQIGVRVRPFNQREIKYNSTNIILMDEEHPGRVQARMIRQGKIVAEPPKDFFFDHAMWTHEDDGKHTFATQQSVYELMGKPVLKNIVDGYNATLFAYGQTGSGKTYSMMGYGEAERGIIPRLCDDLFADVHDIISVAQESQWSIEVSYLEIYNEQVRDLLSPDTIDKALKVRQHPKTGVFVEGLKKVLVTSSDSIINLLEEGGEVRAVASTNMNASSSRSHAVLLLTLSMTTTTDGIVAGKYSRLTLVDLAGSERASSTGARGDTLMEGASINKSLTTLGMCLSRLADQAESGRQGLPIPFRDSNLTFLLHDSFGGNSKTAMLANVSPADVNFDETISSLRFAQVTKRVKNKAVVNENPAARLIRELSEELAGLKGKLANLNRKRLPSTSPSATVSGTSVITAAGGGGLESTLSSTFGGDEEELRRQIEESEAAQEALTGGATLIAAEGATTASTSATSATATGAGSGGGSASPNRDDINNVYVDWRDPHLINLCPESPMLVLDIPAGDSYASLVNPDQANSAIAIVSGAKLQNQHTISLTGASGSQQAICKFLFSPLLNDVSVIALSQTVPISINGQALVPFTIRANQANNNNSSSTDNNNNNNASFPAGGGSTSAASATINDMTETLGDVEPMPIHHGDRLMLGKVILRLAHSSSLAGAPDYSKTYKTSEHLYLAEDFHRRAVEHRWVEGLSKKFRALVIRSGVLDNDDTPESILLEELEGLTVEALADVRQAETSLASQFPITSDELAAHSAAAKAAHKQSLQQFGGGGSPSPRRRMSTLHSDSTFPSPPSSQSVFSPGVSSSRMGGSSALFSESQMYEDDDGEDVVNEEDYLLSELCGGGGAEDAAKKEAWLLEGREEYESALKEQQSALDKRTDLINTLRKELTDAAGGGDGNGGNGGGGHDDMGSLMDDVGSAVTKEADIAKAVEEEMRWHQAAKQLGTFSADGPRGVDDKTTWSRFATTARGNMPFLQELHERQERFYGCETSPTGFVLNPALKGSGGGTTTCCVEAHEGDIISLPRGTFQKMKQHKEQWEYRYFIIIGNFLYYFRACDGTQRCLGAIYLQGSKLQIIIDRPFSGRRNVMLLKASVPRRANEPVSSSFYFCFDDVKDVALWSHWIMIASIPKPIPKGLAARLSSDVATLRESGKIKVGTDILQCLGSGSGGNLLLLLTEPVTEWGMPDANATIQGKTTHGMWKNDQVSTECELCKTGFTFFRRRHHCRFCGGIFCDGCCPSNAIASKRACAACVKIQEEGGDGGAVVSPTDTDASADMCGVPAAVPAGDAQLPPPTDEDDLASASPGAA